jgi:hypothetical protein
MIINGGDADGVSILAMAIWISDMQYGLLACLGSILPMSAVGLVGLTICRIHDFSHGNLKDGLFLITMFCGMILNAFHNLPRQHLSTQLSGVSKGIPVEFQLYNPL